ncbi:rapid alkalinization factor 2, partial [Genlisea aurea]
AGVASGGEHHSASSELVMMSAAMNSGCKGTVGECLAGGDEFELLRSESERRILFARRYISYGALQRDAVPCSRRGASYYNCRPGAQANPYVRGCSAITRCR